MNDSEQILHSEWLRDKLREGSEARHIINRLTPDGKEEVEAVPLEWAVETFQAILQHYISKEEVEKAIDAATPEICECGHRWKDGYCEYCYGEASSLKHDEHNIGGHPLYAPQIRNNLGLDDK